MDFIPLVTDEFRITFCQATEPLCPDIQRIIWKNLLYDNIELKPPPTPQKCRIQYSTVSGSCLPRNLFENLHPTQWHEIMKNTKKSSPSMKRMKLSCYICQRNIT